MLTNRPLAPDATTVGSAPSRLCLGGEDLDWIGGPSLLTAIDLPVEVTYERQPTAATLTIRSEGALRAELNLSQADWHQPTDNVLELIRLSWQHAMRSPVGGGIRVRSAAPANAGLASSATACVAALRAFTSGTPDQALSPEQLIQAAYHVEHDIAGRPVGPMDYVPAAHGGTTLIDSESEVITSVTHLVLPPETRFVVVDTRTPRDTGAVISWKRARHAEGDPGIHHYAERMRRLVHEQAELIRDFGDLPVLGLTLDEAQALLRHRVQVSTPLIDSCVERLRAHGALGVKLTGTGLGGCLFALTTADADLGRLTGCLNDLPVSVHLVRATGFPIQTADGLGT